MKRLQFVTVLLMSAICFCGCKSWQKVVEVPVEVHDTAYVAKVTHDSTYIDRWHTEYVKGDTVFRLDSVSVVKYSLITDTAYKYIERPVIVSKMETVEVEKPLSWWQQTQQYGFWLLLVAVAACVAWRTRRRWL